MSQDKIEIVERFFEARSRGDLSYLDLVDSDAEFDLSESRSTYRGVYRGHEELRKQWQGLQEAWAVTELRPEEPVVVGEQVVVTVQVSAQGRSSGVKLEGQGANVFTFREEDRALQTLPNKSRSSRRRASRVIENGALSRNRLLLIARSDSTAEAQAVHSQSARPAGCG